MYMCLYTCMHIYTYRYIYIYTHIYIHKHLYIYTNILGAVYQGNGINGCVLLSIKNVCGLVVDIGKR